MEAEPHASTSAFRLPTASKPTLSGRMAAAAKPAGLDGLADLADGLAASEGLEAEFNEVRVASASHG